MSLFEFGMYDEASVIEQFRLIQRQSPTSTSIEMEVSLRLAVTMEPCESEDEV